MFNSLKNRKVQEKVEENRKFYVVKPLGTAFDDPFAWAR